MRFAVVKSEERRPEAPVAPPAEDVPEGVAVAALMASMLGMMALAFVNLFTAASAQFNASVYALGKLAMPGGEGIGPYAGKEIMALLAWIGSWVVLHLSLRAREMDISRWLLVFLLGVGVATTLIWPPVYEFLVEF